MVFSSLFFVFFFLPLNLGIYYCRKSTPTRNAVMLVFSLVFYAWGEPKYVLLLVAMALCDWLFAKRIEQNRNNPKRMRLALLCACVVSLGLLGVFKYGMFVQENFQRLFGAANEITPIELPIGISFYTFQLLTYVVDVYRGDVRAENNFAYVLLYASLFHQCVAGPIVRYQDIASQITSRRVSAGNMADGITRFTVGLGKKALLANSCGALADKLLLSDAAAGDFSQLAQNLQILSTRPAAALWLGMAFYTLQIYLDFSAYSDMAIGMGLMTGFRYRENFDYPYVSRSVTEFWRRWHISLGSFFRDYVYIPLGGNRKGKVRTVLNLLIVWALTGLWHGASWNFVLWGLYYFVFLVLEKFLLKKRISSRPILSRVFTMTVVFFGWVLFKFDRMPLVGAVLKGMFCANANPFTSYETGLVFKSHIFLLLAAVVACTPVAKLVKAIVYALSRKGKAGRMASTVLQCAYPCLMLVLSTASLVGNSYNPFLYFQF
ncbi:MAG TPA: membrane-bound O-acyltransferase family protein [Ruminococcaceae bacterium]|nr:membrane-bound O-acyltransferase family protein [Oscillospiraceae bacterium]